MTGGGAENSCTFHINTAPKESATTATNGFQTRAKTVLPRERGLTPSPFGIRSPTAVLVSSLAQVSGLHIYGHISTRLRYDRTNGTGPRATARTHGPDAITLGVPSAARTSQMSNAPEIN